MAQLTKAQPTKRSAAVVAKRVPIRKLRQARKPAPSALDSGIARGVAALAKAEDELAAGVRTAVARTLSRPDVATADALASIGALTEEAIAIGRALGGDLLLIGRAIARGVVLGAGDAGGDAVQAASAVAASAAGAIGTGGQEATMLVGRVVAGAVEATSRRGRQAATLLEEAGKVAALRLMSAGHATAAMAQALVDEASSLIQPRRPVPALLPPKAKRAAAPKRPARAKRARVGRVRAKPVTRHGK